MAAPDPQTPPLQPLGPCRAAADPLELPPAWAERARADLGESPAVARAALRGLRELVLAEDGLFARTDDTFLLAFLRTRKHNVPEAFKMLKNYYKLRKQYPKYTEDCLPSEKGFVYDMDGFTLLAERDQRQRTVVALRTENVDLQRVQTEHFFQQLWTALQLAEEDPLVQVAGVVFIVDLTGFTLRHARIVTPSFARLAIRFVQDSFPVRTQAIHVVFEPFYFDALFALFKPFLKPKLRSRIHLHGSDMSSLHEHVPARLLPPHLGGTAPGWNFAAYREGVANNEPLLRALRVYGYGRRREAGTGAP